MIIENNGIKIKVDISDDILTFQVLEQSEDATNRLQIYPEIHDPCSDIRVRSNRYPSFKKERNIFYLRGFEPKKDNKVVAAKFDSNEKALKAFEGLKRIVDFVNEENFRENSSKTDRYRVKGGTAHCRFFFINRKMAKIIELTGHNGYPKECIEWKHTKPAILKKNNNWNFHIANLIKELNNSLNNNDNSVWAVNKVKEMFSNSEKDGPATLVGFWRTITGLRDCDAPVSDSLYVSNGGTLEVRNAFINDTMAEILDLKNANEYSPNIEWIPSKPIMTDNEHYDEHIGQVVDVLNKSVKNKEYSDGVVNQHRVGSKSAILVIKMIQGAIKEAQEKGDSYLISLWNVMTGLRGPDFEN